MQAVGAPLLIGVDDHFGVGASAKMITTLLQFRSEFYVVEDFAVEHNPDRAVLIAQRLLTGGQIDYRQSGVS